MTSHSCTRIIGLATPVLSICLLSDGRVYAGSTDKFVREFDLATGKESQTFRTSGILDRACPIPSISTSPDGRSLFAPHTDGVHRWDLWDGSKVGKIRLADEGHDEPGRTLCTDFAVSPDGRYLVSGGEDGVVRGHLVATGSTRLFRGHSAPVVKIRVVQGRLYTLAKDGTVRVWDMQTGLERGAIKVEGGDCAVGGGRIWVAGREGVVGFAA